MSDSDADRRLDKRKHPIFYYSIFDASTKSEIGKVIDLTPNGVMVMTDKKIKVGDMLDVVIEFPEGESHIEEKCSAKVSCKWEKTSITDKDLLDIGFHIEEISDDDRKVLVEMSQKDCFKD